MNIGDNLRHQFVRLSYSPEIMSMEFTREEMTTIYDYIKSKEQEIERLNNIINELDKELELERKSRQLLTDDLANVCEMSLKKDNIINKAIEYINENSYEVIEKDEDTEINWQILRLDKCFDLLDILKGVDKE